jgi:acyl-coenzyme A thioesterase PaaI-like protein
MKHKIINPYTNESDIQKGYNCFACAPHNPIGLHLEFYEDGDYVSTTWVPQSNYQSWIDTLHGGIQATLLDETCGWLISRKCQLAGMTTQLTMKYRNPVPTGDDVTIEIRGHIKEIKRNFAFIEATLSHEGKVCSMCDMTYYCFSKEKAESDFFFTGCELL